MDYELKLGEFNGPLDKLLELIEEKKLPISEISLAAVTDDFLKHLDTLPKIDFAILADFISIASRLILIKSKSLLPTLELTEEEEADIKDLEKRLLVYRELKSAKRHVAELWSKHTVSLGRHYFMGSSFSPVFAPGKKLGLDGIVASMKKMFETLEKFTLETETIKEKIISLEEKIKEIVGRITSLGETTLRKLAGASRREVIATFLAILHLARDQMVRLEQSQHFSDIIITKNDG